MTGTNDRYELIAPPEFLTDLERLRRQAKANPDQYRQLFRNVLRELSDLRDGTSNGHHPLGFGPGKGDLRDSVTSYLQSDPQTKADYRLVFREMPPQRQGGLPNREVLAVKPRHGSGNIYEHSLARLSRHANDLQPGLGVFGDKGANSGGNQAQRNAALEARRAVALAYAGQRPLARSRPFDPLQPAAPVNGLRRGKSPRGLDRR